MNMIENPGLRFCHDPHIYKDKNTGKYYIYSTDVGISGEKPLPGGQIRRSDDLITWEYIGLILPEGAPDEVFNYTNSRHVWAPDVVCINDEIRLYLSVSTFGSQNSAIILVTSKNPEGPFEYKGIVIETKTNDPVNAIDANIIVDNVTGEHFMAYGSFWGGIRLLKLDKSTGLVAEDGFGKQLCVRQRSVDGAVEGAYIIFNEQTGYYYLFVSYHSLSSFYNVRIARSKNLDGVYTDFNGRAMTDLEYSPEEIGLKITTGHKFGDNTGLMALGHNSVLNDDGKWYIIHHARVDKQRFSPFAQVRRIFWTVDGWPLVSPITYSEDIICGSDSNFDAVGEYDYILFQNNPADTATQSTRLALYNDGTCTCDSIKGTWDKGDGIIRLHLDNMSLCCFTECKCDESSNKRVVALTGISDSGTCMWATLFDKQVKSGVQELLTL